MKILVLQDDAKRIEIFKKNVGERLDGAVVNYVTTAKDAINRLKSCEYNYIYLDHDLSNAQMLWEEHNNGLLVAEWIVSTRYGNPRTLNIIIHSYNLPRAKTMERVLTKAGYAAVCVPGAYYLIG